MGALGWGGVAVAFDGAEGTVDAAAIPHQIPANKPCQVKPPRLPLTKPHFYQPTQPREVHVHALYGF